MQMSYTNLTDYKMLNTITDRSPIYEYTQANSETNCVKPKKTKVDLWKEANKEAYLAKQKDKALEDDVDNTGKADTVHKTEEELEKEALENATNKKEKETNYIFRMDWNETFFNQQEPDIKSYPAEGIIARYKKAESDLDYEEYLKELDPELDKDLIEDVQKEMSIFNGEWVDTREKAETTQSNKYSSEKFYFDGFAEMKASSGIGSGSGDGSGDGSSLSGTAAAGCRGKIVEMAKKIVDDYNAGKAKYCQSPRTTDYDKPKKDASGKVCYDCTSFVSCCYKYAGLNSMVDKSCSGGSLIAEIVKNGGEMWLLNDAGFAKAKPGDVVIKANSRVTESDMGKQISTTHAMIYIGDGKASNASSPSSGILTENIKTNWRSRDNKHFFVRPKDLIEADKQAENNSGIAAGNTTTKEIGNDKLTTVSLMRYPNTNNQSFKREAENIGEIDGLSYVAKIPKAVCSSYYGGNNSASGLGLENNKTCASHNIPYGTKLYIPSLKEQLGGDGIVVVTDTGNPTFDFNIYTKTNMKKTNIDVYVLSWGDGKIAPSYTWAMNLYSDNQWSNLKYLWNNYKLMNGKLMNFLLFNQEDTNIKNHKRF